MSKKNRQRGKDYERWIAKDLGGRRVGLLGFEDVLTQKFAIECKERKKLPKFVVNTMEQAENNAPEGKIPVVCLHELHAPHEKDLVIMYYEDWRKLI